MERRKLGKTGYEVSVLGFGGGPVGYLDVDAGQVGKVLNLLLDRGVNLVDTAAAYRGSEEAIGKAVGHRRDEFVLVSKCGQAFPDIDGPAWAESTITRTIDRALTRLKTGHIDVMLLHSCDLDTLKKGEALGALVKARDAGKVRFVGFSGDNERARYAAELDDVAVIETTVNLCDHANIETLLPITRRNDIGILAKRPIANAAWRAASDRKGIYVDYAEPYAKRLAAMNLDPAELGFAGPVDDAWPEIALRFTLAQPDVTTAIVGTTRTASAERNLAFAEKGPLPPDAVARIRKAFRRAEQSAGEPWPSLQ
jgi:aryl-alcohol dehydrogenase-like predicted oxidoreductase